MQENSEANYMKPVCEPYQNDTKTPVFSRNSKAYTSQMLIKILLQRFEKEAQCVATPINVAHNVSFLVDNSSLRQWSDVKSDDMGAWVNKGCPKLYINLKENKDETIACIERCEKNDVKDANKFCMLKRSYYVNAASTDCRKVISTLHGKKLGYFTNILISHFSHIFFYDVPFFLQLHFKL